VRVVRDAAEILAEELAEEMSWCTVVGYFPVTNERWLEYYPVDDARTAEDMAQADARAKGATLQVCGVFAGRQKSIDTYATFVDPDA
jgi:L-alanine-DL-glutamate epimerase-like enolase superfamily enzyme